MISPQTCDKNKNEFLEVNFSEQKQSQDYIGFADVFEISSDSKKTFLLDRDIKKNGVFMHLWSTLCIGKNEQKNNNASRVRSEDFLVIFKIVKKTMGFYRIIESNE